MKRPPAPNAAAFFSYLLAICLLANFCPAAPAAADGHHPHEELHFTHPLIAESPTPDTKLRFDFAYRRIDKGPEKGNEQRFLLEAEYALYRSLSLELDIPLVRSDLRGAPSHANFDSVAIALKGANFDFASRGLLLGYGFELALPTGDDEEGIGSDHLVELEPFLDFGWKRGPLELVGFASFAIPINQRPGEEAETELGYNAAALYHFSNLVAALIELDGTTVLSGSEDGASTLNLAPALLFEFPDAPGLTLGAGAAFAVTKREEFETQLTLALFYHFD